MNIKAGDVVQLKSGGPKMTVSKVGEFLKARGRTTALCTWFDNDAKVQEKIFEPAQLKIVKESTD